MTSRRLGKGGLIDRDKPLNFTFDGRNHQGFEGDTLASALLANGVRLMGRSFKYHRPRGVLSAGSDEPNALVELGTGARREPNTRATTIELYDGLTAQSQNRWPSLRYDVMAVNGVLSPFLKAGFYYKTFMWPKSFWERVYEPLIRRAAGLGVAAGEADPDIYEKAFAFCDVLVIGGGPSGLAAALAAGRSGARVILCDEDFRFGGRLLSDRHEINADDARNWVASALAELQTLPDVRIFSRTTVFGVYDGGTYAAVQRVHDHVAAPPEYQPRQRSWRIVAKRTILAAGSLERPLVFGGNDRPGVMLAGAVRTYLNRYGAVPGKSAVVFTSCDDGWRTAQDLTAAGAYVAAVVDARAEVATGVTASASLAGANILLGARVVATSGSPELKAIEIINAKGKIIGIACDLLAVSNGWSPTVHLTCHLGSKPVWNIDKAMFLPGAAPRGMVVTGAANGNLTLAEALAEGTRAGRSAAQETGFNPGAAENWHADDEPSSTSPVWYVAGSKGKAFADFQNDVTADDLELAHREGFRHAEHAKRYTTLGMATDQGKTSNVAGLGILAALNEQPMGKSGTTVFRPPYTPVTLGALAGHHRGRDFKPTRVTSSHAFAEEQGAAFVESGLWLRAQMFPKVGDSEWLETVSREVRIVRSAVGVCDVSTLGKIEVHGPGAVDFLDFVYCTRIRNLAVGKCRYGLMLREDGFVMDDGTVARLGQDAFFITTTTANAAKVMQHLEFCHQVLRPELDVRITSVTEQWAQFSVAGPRARDTLSRVMDTEQDISNEALPYLGVKEVRVGGGIPARLYRLSFSGELAFEIGVPADFGDACIRAIISAGAEFGITPYGTETLGVMRIEKGHVGLAEMNGQTTARDLGLSKMVALRKDYVGRLMAQRPALLDGERPRFVGFKPVDRTSRLRVGAHFVARGKAQTAEHDEGYMTSVAFSPSLDHWVGLGLIKRGPDRIGERIIAADPLRDATLEVEITDPVFIDPEGERLYG